MEKIQLLNIFISILAGVFSLVFSILTVKRINEERRTQKHQITEFYFDLKRLFERKVQFSNDNFLILNYQMKYSFVNMNTIYKMTNCVKDKKWLSNIIYSIEFDRTWKHKYLSKLFENDYLEKKEKV